MGELVDLPKVADDGLVPHTEGFELAEAGERDESLPPDSFGGAEVGGPVDLPEVADDGHVPHAED